MKITIIKRIKRGLTKIAHVFQFIHRAENKNGHLIHSSPEIGSERFLTQNIHAASLTGLPESERFVLQLHLQIWTGRAVFRPVKV